MSVKKLTIDCDCVISVCDHAYEKVSDLLQSGYDDGYDEGWNDAFVSIKEGLADLGFDRASKLETPPPPRRATKSRTQRVKPIERLH